MTLAERFYARFAGLDRGHGRAWPKGGSVNGHGPKQQTPSKTVHEPPTVELWEQHLAGTYSLGIVPIRDDATCCFGAIDIDKYDKELSVLADQLQLLQLPLTLCRSKSGGAHLYLFMKEDCPAELVRGKLMEWAVALGYSGVEIFPKQTRLAGQNDYGNWINMPYYDAEKTPRYAVMADGARLTAEQFMDLADTMAISIAALRKVAIQQDEALEDYLDGVPPCLQSLIVAGGIAKGGRNNGLFNIGVYLRKRYGDLFAEKLDEYNQKFIDPPLGHKEVAVLVKSLGKKVYEYKCRDDPIQPVCNRQICLTRKFGVGSGDKDPGVTFGQLVKIETKPPIWIWDVNGARIELTTFELKDQARFHNRCIDELNVWPNPIKPKDWAELVREKLDRVEVQEVPPDATQEGQVWSLLENYCTGRATAKKQEDLLQYKPWTEEGVTWFSAVHFQQFLEQNRLRVDARQLWAWLRNRDTKHRFMNIKGRGINCWGVRAFEAQTEAFSVPTLEPENM